jgi:transposase
VLCEFRSRLVKGNVEQLILDVMLRVWVERKWLKARGKQRTDSIHVLAPNPNAQSSEMRTRGYEGRYQRLGGG